jgi:hypothetical protein
MKERLLESLAILLAGLFSAERPKPWRLGDAGSPSPRDAARPDTAGAAVLDGSESESTNAAQPRSPRRIEH